ncbi:MAG: hypothetical protein GVY13_14210 [Alphaproteobacteria bacterium]|nr:hypothetical protein [Alphaproteobacteria bacterium]
MAVAAILCLAPLGLGACVPTELDRTTRPVTEFQVEQVRMARDLTFLPGDVALDPGNEAQLDAFLAQVSPTADDRIAVIGHGPLGEARARATALALQTRGVTPDRTVAVRGAGDGVTLSVERTLYQATACQQSTDVREPAGGTRLPSPGCATADNLARMIAQPSDLLQGRETSPSPARLPVAAVEAYRRGEIISLEGSGE